MTDELDDLKHALDAATPAPDAGRKAANLRLAEKNFARLQGTPGAARHTSERGYWTRVLDGGKTMLNVMTTRAGLTATTALVAVGLLIVLPEGGNILTPRTELSAPAEVPVQDEIGRARGNAVQGPVAGQGRREAAEALEGRLAGTGSDAVRGDGTGDDVAAATMAETESMNEDVAAAPPPAMPSAEPAGQQPLAKVARERAADPGLQTRQGAMQAAPVIEVAPAIRPESDTEAFSNAPTSSLKVTVEEPVSTFSIDVDTASYAVVRSSLTRGQLPPRDAVRVEEMVNYFPYDYPAPDGAHPFEPTITVLPSPWNPGTELVHIGIQGTLPAIEDRPPLNLVFLIDTSGSMQDANKLPLLKQSFRLMLAELRPEDEVSIVTYAGSAGQVLAPTRAAERATILAALDRLEAGGSTAGGAGIELAYRVAEGMAADGEVTRVVLATDGDFNVGISDPERLKEVIAEKRESGTYLSVLGFGRGNLDDATMQALAQNGNGTAAYIDTLAEARKVLVDQLTGALFPIANDVKIQIEFNPAQVAEYRLIGYETRELAREDFNNDKVDAGDIGAGHSVTAIYEITPVGSDAVRTGPLRYAEAGDRAAVSDELGYFKMRYKRPGEATSVLIEEPILPGQGAAGEDVRFSVAIAGFGELLRGGEYLGAWDWDELIALASSARGDDPFGYRAEAVTLMRLAETLSK